MRVLVILAASLFFTISSVQANPEPTPDQKIVSEGLMLILKGEKQKAWELLFPEAKKGNVDAMFHLGSMMMRSPEYPDNLERAEQFFTVAAQRGHVASKTFLAQIEELKKKRASGPSTLIAGVSGGPTPEQLADAKNRVAKYKAEVLRYTGFVDQVPARATIKVFLPQSGPAIEAIYNQVTALNSQIPEGVKIEFFIVIDPAKWQQEQETNSISKIPPSGVMPDFKGEIASTYGITSTPAFVIAPAQGKARVVSKASDLIPELSKFL
jgi:TPR repeat protein